ncbi:MAG: sensor histidine kinase [Sphingomonadales bacterium]|nr:sensor histidine kinase [Sphingomonadales bacterium]
MAKYDAIKRAVVARRTPAAKALILVAVVIVPTALRLLLGGSATAMPFVTYYPGILFAAIFAGWRWGALATALSALAANRLFLPQSLLSDPTPTRLALLAYFALSCAVIVATGEALRRTMREMERAAAEREVFGREMFHRVQNVLAVVQALARTGDPGQDVAQFRDALSGRIAALSAANQHLWDPARHQRPVRRLVELALEPFGSPRRFTMEGPEQVLSPDHGHQLVLILHELAANAIRHGALSAAAGKVAIAWTGSADDFRLEWCESGGPPVSPPSRRGLGTRLLESQRLFRVASDYRPAGLVCTIEARNAED